MNVLSFEPIDITADTSLSGLMATMDLSDTYCNQLKYLCARLYRASNSNPAFKLTGEPDDQVLIACAETECEGRNCKSPSLVPGVLSY